MMGRAPWAPTPKKLGMSAETVVVPAPAVIVVVVPPLRKPMASPPSMARPGLSH